MNDELLFAPEDDELKSDPNGSTATISEPPWKVLIVDDEEEVHAVTKMVLSDVSFDNRDIVCLSAHSAGEGYRLLNENPDIAVVLLDVVMETNQAGLDLVRRIREDLNNPLVRIVLRTGQPGQAPEREVITRYDINDYKHKTELTAQRLFTTVITALRSYDSLRAIDRSKRGLEYIIKISRDLFRIQSLPDFTKQVLGEMAMFAQSDDFSAVPALPAAAGEFRDGKNVGALALEVKNGAYTLLAGTANLIPADLPPGSNLNGLLPDKLKHLLQSVLDSQENYFSETEYVGYYQSPEGLRRLFYMSTDLPFTRLDHDLITVLTGNIGIALDNLALSREIIETQKEVVLTLGEVVETRMHETANHVARVAEFSYELAKLYGIPDEEAELMRLASPMHDVGKIGIPDSILLKPGRLTDEEMEVMRTHAEIGYSLLCKSQRPILQTAAVIARQHHERWDGNGYPQKLAGEGIHIYGRITAVADVFDALMAKRCYKDPWPLEKVIGLFKEERGKHFDPKLTDLFLDNIAIFTGILAAMPDD